MGRVHSRRFWGGHDPIFSRSDQDELLRLIPPPGCTFSRMWGTIRTGKRPKGVSVTGDGD
jgi:hypothetical protein